MKRHPPNKTAWKLVYRLLKLHKICVRCRSRYSDVGMRCLRCWEATQQGAAGTVLPDAD